MSSATSGQIPRRAAGAWSASAAPSASTAGTDRAGAGASAQRWDRAGLALASALAASYLMALAAAPEPLPQDLPDWTHQGWLLARAIAGDPAAEGFTLKSYPVPNTLGTLVLAVLTSLFDAGTAARIASLLPLMLGLPCLWLYAQRAAPATPGLLAAALFGTLLLSTPFWLGYLSYTLGFVLLMAAVSRPVEDWSPAALLGWSLLLFLASAVVFAAFVLLAAWRLGVERRQPSSLWPLLPAIGLLLWYVAGRLLIDRDLAGDAEGGGPLALLATYLTWKPWTFTSLGPAREFVSNGQALLPLPQGLAAVQMAVLNASFAGVLAAVLAGRLWRRRASVALPAVPGLLLALGFVLAPPVFFFGLINVGERLLAIGLLLLLPLARPSPRALALLICLALPAHGLNLGSLAHSGSEDGPPARWADAPYRVPVAERGFILDAIDARQPIPIMPGYATGIWQP